MGYKYEEVKGYWVYSIKIPSINKYYIGVSGYKKCCDRWKKSKYKGMALEPYLDEWETMEKTVLIDGLSSKKEALIYEDNIIRALNNLCINERRSGLISVNDKNAYMREYYQNNTEYREQKKQYRENNKEKIQEYMNQYYKRKKLEKQ